MNEAATDETRAVLAGRLEALVRRQPFQRMLCELLGHRLHYTEWAAIGIASPSRCTRCGHERPGIEWPRPPPMPATKEPPACDLRDFYDSAMELLPYTQVSAIVVRAKRKAQKE